LPVRGRLAAPHQGVRFDIMCGGSLLYMGYRGTPEDLLRCGAVTAPLLEHRSKNQYDEAVDSDGDHVRISRRRGRPWVVHRWKTRGLDSMPGLEDWMVEAAKANNAAAAAVQRGELTGCARTLSPEEWRANMIGRLRSGVGFAVHSMNDQNDPHDVHLQEGWEPDAADLEAIQRRAEAVTEDLGSMIARQCVEGKIDIEVFRCRLAFCSCAATFRRSAISEAASNSPIP
jgi:hypothetical protein